MVAQTHHHSRAVHHLKEAHKALERMGESMKKEPRKEARKGESMGMRREAAKRRARD